MSDDDVESLPDRPLTFGESHDLSDDGRFIDLSYMPVFGDGIEKEMAEDAMGLVAILANSGEKRHLLGYSPIDEEWHVVWEGADEETASDPFEDADQWAREHWGLSSRLVFDMPGPKEDGDSK